MYPSAAFADCEAQTECSQSQHHQQNAIRIYLQDSEQQDHNRNKHGWRKVVLNFTPSWFAVTTGTGIVSILLHNLPFNARWIYWISVAIFCLNILLFVTFTAISILRYLLFRGLASFVINHPAQSLFVGTFPMGLTTIVNTVVFVCVPVWGHWAITLAWTLWRIDVVLSLATCFYLPFIIMYKHETALPAMTAAWLLPIVSTIVASASGGIVAEILPNPQRALWTVIVSYILWGTGFPQAMVVLVMYFHRLIIHHLPPRKVIVSVFLPLGPLGQGSFALMQLGRVARQTFPQTETLDSTAGATFYNVGHAAALVIWGYGLPWLFLALAGISRSKFPFNMGWWGFAFPLGVYAVPTTTLGKDLPSLFFRVLGTIFSLIVVLLWLLVSIKTIPKVMTGEIFFAPCVQKYEAQMAAEKIEASYSEKWRKIGGSDGADHHKMCWMPRSTASLLD